MTQPTQPSWLAMLELADETKAALTAYWQLKQAQTRVMRLRGEYSTAHAKVPVTEEPAYKELLGYIDKGMVSP